MTRHEDRRSRLYRSNDLPNDGVLNLNWDFETAYRFVRAMDYHGMNVMPRPKVELRGELRCIESYSVEAFSIPRGTDELIIPSADRSKALRCQLER
ncbi:MAG: hypothetical protein IJ668_04790 [Selenomonadaceae bacterium]|nr:hypothetical protein [Selenomonadaceae bacterium]